MKAKASSHPLKSIDYNLGEMRHSHRMAEGFVIVSGIFLVPELYRETVLVESTAGRQSEVGKLELGFEERADFK